MISIKEQLLECHNAIPGFSFVVASEDKRKILPLQREVSRKTAASDNGS